MTLLSTRPMNVSPTWIEQMQIAEHGSEEQRIVLAKSDGLLDSVQLALARSYQSTQVKNALGQNPKLTPLAKLLLAGKYRTSDDWRLICNIADEETLRAYTIHPDDIIHHPNLPESMAIDWVQIDLGGVVCNLNHFKIVDNQDLPLLFSYKEFLIELIKGVFTQEPQWHSLYQCDYNIFADYLIEFFSQDNLLGRIDVTVQIYLVQALKDYELNYLNNKSSVLFDCLGHKITKGGICLGVIKKLASHSKINLDAKVILHDILDTLQNKK